MITTAEMANAILTIFDRAKKITADGVDCWVAPREGLINCFPDEERTPRGWKAGVANVNREIGDIHKGTRTYKPIGNEEEDQLYVLCDDWDEVEDRLYKFINGSGSNGTLIGSGV
ncbi:MAG: hypothetical protein WC054_03990 [Candidatus Nanopelagicales bacterium]